MAAPSAYRKGSILRVKLHQFLTYQDVEFRPGPRLNVVMGPNGTGKSSIVCAIAVGLGAPLKVLERAPRRPCRDAPPARADGPSHARRCLGGESLNDFILKTKDSALVELELLLDEDSGATRTIERQLSRTQRGTSKWRVDGRAATEPQVRKMVEEEFNIQIANLCTFLPQEKVGQFSGFDDVDLLREAQKAIGGQALLDQHVALVELERKFKDAARKSKTVAEELEDVAHRKRALEPDVEKVRRRRAHVEQAELLEKKLAICRFQEKRLEALEAKEARKAAGDEVRKAQAALEPLKEARNEAQREQQRSKQAYDRVQQKILDKTHAQDAAVAAFARARGDLDGAADGSKNAEARVTSQRRKVDKERAALDAAERALTAAGSTDTTALKARYQALLPAKQEAERAVRRAQDAAQDAAYAVGPAEAQLKHAKAREADLSNAGQRRARKFEQRVGRSATQCLALRRWLDANAGQFRKPVHGPFGLEVDVRDDGARAILEWCVSNWMWTSFVCSDKHDYDKLRDLLQRDGTYSGVNLHINAGAALAPRRPYAPKTMDGLKKVGARGYLDEFVEAPQPVMNLLMAHHAIDAIVIGGQAYERAFGDGKLDVLQTGKGYLTFSATPLREGGVQMSRFQAMVSRYGAKDTLINTMSKQGPSGFVPPAEAQGADDAREAADAVARAEADVKQAKAAAARARKDADAADAACADASREVTAVGKEITKRNKNRNAVADCERKLEAAEKKLQRDEADLERQRAQQARALQAALRAVTDAAAKRAALGGEIATATVGIAGPMAAKDAGKKRLEAAAERLDAEKATHQDANARFERANAAFNALKEEARALKELQPDEAALDAATTARLEALPDASDDVELALREERAQAARIHDDPRLEATLADLQRRYDELKAQVDRLGAANDAQQTELEALRAPWERRLRTALAELKAKFGAYMGTLGARGDVEINESEHSFAKWGLSIRVAFRDSSDLQQLAAHVQSGGERSVSTIMFLMALQAHMPSPFRVVDEINQGMDETNERIVFRRIVLNSTGPDAPQYFLITPKLLQGLYDMEHPDVRALIVFNGAYNVKRPADWDLPKFLEKKRRLLAAAG